MSNLQKYISALPPRSVVDFHGEVIELTEALGFDKDITVKNATFKATSHYDYVAFEGAMLHAAKCKITLKNVTLIGWGNLEWNVKGFYGFNCHVSIKNCIFQEFEYASIFLDGCVGKVKNVVIHQHQIKPSGRGLDYGLVTQNINGSLVLKDSYFEGVRHGVILGENSAKVTIDNCFIKGKYNVNALAMKPTSSICMIRNCRIFGGVNPFGIHHIITNNWIEGLSKYAQAGCCIYHSRDKRVKDCSHMIINNYLKASENTGWRGAIHVDMEEPKGSFVVSGNTFLGRERRCTGNVIPIIGGGNYYESQ